MTSFALTTQLGGDTESSEEEEVKEAPKPKKNNSKNKGPKKGKGKAKAQKQESSSESEDIDAVLEKFSTPSAPKSVVVAQRHLFDIQPKNLNSNEELKRIFGSEIVRTSNCCF